MEVFTAAITGTIIFITHGIFTVHSIMVITGVLIHIIMFTILMLTMAMEIMATITVIRAARFSLIQITGQDQTVRPRI